jgi:hypothetical protein
MGWRKSWGRRRANRGDTYSEKAQRYRPNELGDCDGAGHFGDGVPLLSPMISECETASAKVS